MQILDELSDLNEKLGLLGIDTMEAEIEKILIGLGFSRVDFHRQTDEFSGGWRMRIELAKILLQQSDLLLLDEPTNHLDIESIQWLEDFLGTYPGAVVLISHDRAFLDNLTNRTIEVSLGKIYDYAAPYTKYLEQRKERREQEIAAYTNQQKHIKEQEEFINRFRAKATKAVQVQSRIKALDRLDRIEIDVEDNAAMRFSFPPAPHSGKVSLMVEDVAKSYDAKTIFTDVGFSIERGEKIALLGKNGEGKSTMSRLIF
jgi:ATP-binding cassette subfamily F protein 3